MLTMKQKLKTFLNFRSHTNQLRPRYSESQNVPHNVWLDYFKLTPQHTLPADESNINAEIELVPFTDGQTTSSDELQTIRDPLSVTSRSSSTSVNNPLTTFEFVTPNVEVNTPTNSIIDPVIQTDEATPALRRSNRRKRCTVWTPD